MLPPRLLLRCRWPPPRPPPRSRIGRSSTTVAVDLGKSRNCPLGQRPRHKRRLQLQPRRQLQLLQRRLQPLPQSRLQRRSSRAKARARIPRTRPTWAKRSAATPQVCGAPSTRITLQAAGTGSFTTTVAESPTRRRTSSTGRFGSNGYGWLPYSPASPRLSLGCTSERTAPLACRFEAHWQVGCPSCAWCQPSVR